LRSGFLAYGDRGWPLKGIREPRGKGVLDDN
jgi:hypothetical protein